MYNGTIVRCFVCDFDFEEYQIEMINGHSYCPDCHKRMLKSKAITKADNGDRMALVYHNKIAQMRELMEQVRNGKNSTTTAQAGILAEFITVLTTHGAMLELLDGKTDEENREMIIKQARAVWGIH